MEIIQALKDLGLIELAKITAYFSVFYTVVKKSREQEIRDFFADVKDYLGPSRYERSSPKVKRLFDHLANYYGFSIAIMSGFFTVTYAIMVGFFVDFHSLTAQQGQSLILLFSSLVLATVLGAAERNKARDRLRANR